MYKKIDIYRKVEGGLVYACSTNQSKTCREAKDKYCVAYPKYKPENIIAYFSRR